MASMIPCYDCFSADGKIDYGDFKPTSYPCCNCKSRVYKKEEWMNQQRRVSRMRLIDADKIDFRAVFGGENEFAKDVRNAAQMLIDNQPTSYDVDKVVEQLEEFRAELAQFGADGILTDMIEVVRAGGKG